MGGGSGPMRGMSGISSMGGIGGMSSMGTAGGARANITQGPVGANLFVLGFPDTYTDGDLAQLFSGFGTVTICLLRFPSC